MVMMQSPISDIPQPTSPRSTTPNSPNNNNNTTKAMNISDGKFHKFESIRLERPQPTKFDGILLARFQEHDDNDMKNRPLIYPKESGDLEASAKFSIERLKQLTGQNINRLSPSEDSNQSSKYSHEARYNLSPGKSADGDANLHHSNSLNIVNSSVAAAAAAAAKYATLNPNELADLERFKRTMVNGKELSDFGFRIQLGGLNTNYARSETSEELNVDGNDDVSSQEGGGMGDGERSTGAATVCMNEMILVVGWWDRFCFVFFLSYLIKRRKVVCFVWSRSMKEFYAHKN